MYNDHWGTTRGPFENDVDPRCYVASPTHQGALLKLKYLLESGKAAGLLVSEHGLGKTYLTHVLQQDVADRHPVVRIIYPKLSPAELLCDIAVRLGATLSECDATRCPVDRVLRTLEGRLRELDADGSSPLIVIDDTHLCESPEVLETVQLLLNIRHQAEPLRFAVLLCGRPQLLSQVERVAGLQSRIDVRLSLHPLDLEQTRQYVTHRLSIAGRNNVPFDDDALQAVWELSGGVPRQINRICDLTLLVGYADGLKSLSARDVDAAAEEVALVSSD